MVDTDHNSVRFPEVRRCIYCPDTQGPFSDEHIVAFGLGGNLILPKASCPSCQRVTSQVERVSLRNTLYRLRIRHEFPTRRPKQRLDRFPIKVKKPDGEHEEFITGSQLPSTSWCLPILTKAGILLNRTPEQSEGGKMLAVVTEPDAKKMIAHGGGKHSVSFEVTKFDYKLYLRMIAKIAHGYAVALLGIDGFTPCLRELILKGHAHPTYWVGGDPVRRTPRAFYYQLRLHEAASTKGLKYFVVYVRLLSSIGTPEYSVVVGTPVDDRFSMIDLRNHRRTADEVS